ncbi:MAG: YHYH protein [Bdellovibrionales bacterium]
MRWLATSIFLGAVGVALWGCNNSSTSSSSAESCTSGTDVVETITTMINGPTVLSCTTNIASDAPDWIKNNFHCVTVQTCSTTYKFILTSLPPYKTNYYSAASGNQATFPTTGLSDGAARSKNPNTIATQSITMYIPKSPTYRSSSWDSTSGSGLDCIGVTTYGVCMFNNQAAPGDSLATEFATMDNGDDHPESTGKYHHHTEPYYLSDDDNKFIGVMLDGYPVYGKKKEDNSFPTLDSNTHAVSCTTTLFPSGTYCYHVANGTGVNADLIGSYFQGTRGSVQ